MNSCNFEVKLHIVDQTRSMCLKNKVSCKVIIFDDKYIDDLEVKVVEVPAEDLDLSEASTYFDEALAESATLAVASANDGSISYEPAVTGMVNVIVACGTFKRNSRRTCALSNDLATMGEGETASLEFMLLIQKDTPSSSSRSRAAKSKRAKGSGGFKRLLQEEEVENGSDLVVTFPQSFVWESSEELYYPMILSSLTVWTVDACLLLPPGHVLTAVMDANSTEPLPLDGECAHVMVPGEDLVLLFQPVQDIPWGLRALAKKPAIDEIRGHIEANEKGGAYSNSQRKTINFSTKARGRSNANGKGAQGGAGG